MKRKVLAIGIILFFVATAIFPSTAQNIEKPSLPTSIGHWLYVGGSGPGNYTRIQDAIDNATEGDTVFVYSGKYNESLLINKSIVVCGQERNTTIIEGGDNIYMSVILNGANVEFKRFRVERHFYGIYLSDCVQCLVSETSVGSCYWGISIGATCDSIIVSNNTIQDCTFGMSILSSKNITISCNIIDGDNEGKGYGIDIESSYRNTIKRNTIMNYLIGINFEFSRFTIIQENNFFSNDGYDAFFMNSFFSVWKQNYWDSPHLFPKIILGSYYFGGFWAIPYLNFDWHPVQEPYDIPG